MTNQNIDIDQLDSLRAELSSTANGKGASLIGLESGKTLEQELADFAAAAGGTGIVDVVSFNFAGGSTGSSVVAHNLGSVPLFAFAFHGGDMPGPNQFSNRSYGFWQNNAFGGPNARVYVRHGNVSVIWSSADSIMATANNPGTASFGPQDWSRCRLSAVNATDVTFTRENGGGGNGAGWNMKLRVALVG